jgi:hypothetical protein
VVAAYNKAALALNPPKPMIDWSKVSYYMFLEEFNLLHDTKQDIFDKPLANAVVREAIKQHICIKHAKEEITNCNIEIRQLHTSILDEHQLFDVLLQPLEQFLIYGAVHEYILRRCHVNDYILARIHQTYSLAGFSGVKGPGIRKGSVVAPLPPTVDTVSLNE